MIKPHKHELIREIVQKLKERMESDTLEELKTLDENAYEFYVWELLQDRFSLSYITSLAACGVMQQYTAQAKAELLLGI